MARKLRRKIGEILLETGVISKEQLKAGLDAAAGTAKKLGEVLVEQEVCDDAAIVKALADQFGMQFITLDGTDGEPDMALIPKDVIQKHTVVPLSKEGGKLQLIIHDPLNLELLDLLRFRLNCEIEPVLAPKAAILATLYSALPAILVAYSFYMFIE